MNERIRAVDCPSCGAPIELPTRHQRLFQCKFCGTTLEDLSTPKEKETGQYPKVIIHAASAVRSTKATGKDGFRKKKRTRWITLFLIFDVVVAIILIALWQSGALPLRSGKLVDQINSSRIYSFGLSRLLPSDNDTQPDMIGVTNNSDDTTPMIYIDFDAEPHLRWQSEPLSDGATYVYNHVTADHANIYMAYETTLVAFNRHDGTIHWQQELSDQVSQICQNCLMVFENRIIALTDDGMLYGVNIQNGEVDWSVRLNETPRQLISFNGKIGVLDSENDVVGINLYTLEQGNRFDRIVPECPNEVFPDSPHTLSIYDPVLVAEGDALFIPISGYDFGCLQKWNPTTLNLEWEAGIPDDIIRSLDWDSFLMTEKALFTSDGHNLFSVNLLNGEYKNLLHDEDHNLTPLAEQNGILITLAERTRGTRRYLLWGIDISKQETAWQIDPVAEDFYGESSTVVYEEGLWEVGTATDQLVLLEAFSNPGTLTFTVLNPLDGSTIATNTFEISRDDSSYWMHIAGWNGERVYLEIGPRLWIFDVLTGTKIDSWP